jgi:hypothetical protein
MIIETPERRAVINEIAGRLGAIQNEINELFQLVMVLRGEAEQQRHDDAICAEVFEPAQSAVAPTLLRPPRGDGPIQTNAQEGETQMGMQTDTEPASKENTMHTTDTTTEHKRDFATISREMFEALIKIAGQAIDPATCECVSTVRYVLDPYEVYPPLSHEDKCAGTLHFVRNPGTGIWIEFCDLPEATQDAIRNSPRTDI